MSSRCGLGKFRYRGRQFEHVIDNQGSSVSLETNPVLGPAMASTGEADCGHAGSLVTFACWYAGQCPPVVARHSPRRAMARISAGEVMTRDVRYRSFRLPEIAGAPYVE